MRIVNRFCGIRILTGPTLVGGAVFSVAVVPIDYVAAVMLFWAFLALSIAVNAFVKTHRVSRLFSGNLLEFVFAPTPMSSLYRSLQEHGIAPTEIASLSLMSADITQSLHYFERGDGKRAFIDSLKENPDLEVTIYGRCALEVSEFKGIAIKRTRDRYVEHINLLSTKDQRHFVWYEPYHEILDGKHHFPEGAYLFEVSARTAAQLKEQLESLPVL